MVDLNWNSSFSDLDWSLEISSLKQWAETDWQLWAG